ncbi:MAG: hypothetical protein CVU56_22765 [Deltaproteobacteria bacterium HGW-Deltaproteobacteria-14]|jgi:hypothetical protein|nr:MAG: hypothetical protein CVU56_22765 [Deltaproteobacteria bacterium HGW-Deltaproteobacteria-14]
MPSRTLMLSVTLALFALATTIATRPAQACGGFFQTEPTQNLAIDAQRALFVWHEKTVDVHLQLVADTDGAEFAWVVPVPVQPELSLGDAAVFDALDALTTPSIQIVRDAGGGGGFCGSADAAGGLAPNQDGVQHFGGGVLGDYQWDLIAGDSATAVGAWLGDHGYVLPDAFAAAAQPYLDDGMRFLAVRLTPTARDGALDLQPLVVTMPRPGDSRLVFPLGFSKVSAIDVTPVVLYVLADKRYRVANAASVELRTVAAELGRRFDQGDSAAYEDVVDGLTDAGGGRFVVTEFAGDLAGQPTLSGELTALLDADTHYLTRLFARVPRASLEDLVITFANEAQDVSNHAIADAGGPGKGTSLAFAFAALLFGVGVVRRRAS